MLRVSRFFGLIVAFAVPFYYEIWEQKFATIEQLLFDLFGILGYRIYINWAYDKNIKFRLDRLFKKK